MAGLSDLLARLPFMPQPQDPGDLTNAYNTKLSPSEEAAFLKWAKANNRLRDMYDYDLRGAWKAMAKQSANGHFPDTFKKPNHPTFSNESQYALGPVLQGGQWGANTFTPGQTNLQFHPRSELAAYMAQVEPDYKLGGK